MKALKVLTVSCFLWLSANMPTQATPLDLILLLPDLNGALLNVSYDASSSNFAAVGFTADYWDPNGNEVPPVDLGTYPLTATITTAGELTGGSLEINSDLGEGMQTLLAGDLNTGFSGPTYGAWGFKDPPSENYDIFEFLFKVTGGTKAYDFGGINADCGVILSAFFGSEGGFQGTWTESFANDGSGAADTAPVPEPASGSLLLVGGALFAVLRRRWHTARTN
jgi:hypothetical protein